METIFDVKSALSLLDNDMDLLKTLLDSFVNDKHFDLNTLESLEKTNQEEAAKYVHYFKGAGRQLACTQLAKDGQALEDVLRNKATGNIQELNENFMKAYENAFKAINETLMIL